jgi:hypothetical protein
MTTTLQESQKEKESNSHKEKESDIDSITTIRTAKKMMSKIKKHVIQDNCSCCKRAIEID